VRFAGFEAFPNRGHAVSHNISPQRWRGVMTVICGYSMTSIAARLASRRFVPWRTKLTATS
jgi:hypothetical protein